jgi:hypothetical protein
MSGTKHPIERLCGQCGRVAARVCPNCQLAYYCTESCEQAHTEEHRYSCQGLQRHAQRQPGELEQLKAMTPVWMQLVAQMISGNLPNMPLATRAAFLALADLCSKNIEGSPVCAVFFFRGPSGVKPNDQELAQLLMGSVISYISHPARHSEAATYKLDTRFEMRCFLSPLVMIVARWPIDWNANSQRNFAECQHRFLLSASWHGSTDMYWSRMGIKI